MFANAIKLSDVLKPQITSTVSKVFKHLDSMKDDELIPRRELSQLLSVSIPTLQRFDTIGPDYVQLFRKVMYYGKPSAIKAFRKQIGAI